MVSTYTAFTQCPDSGVEPGRWVRSVYSCGVSLTCVYTVIPLKEQTPQVGQNEQAQGRNFSCYTWKSSIHCGCRPSFRFTHTNKAVSDPACGVEPYKFGGAQKMGQTPAIGAGDLRLHWGAKGGSAPAIGALCKCSISYWCLHVQAKENAPTYWAI